MQPLYMLFSLWQLHKISKQWQIATQIETFNYNIDIISYVAAGGCWQFLHQEHYQKFNLERNPIPFLRQKKGKLFWSMQNCRAL